MGSSESKLNMLDVKENMVNFSINGTEHSLFTEQNPKIGPQTLLVDYIRDQAGLKGTKYMCREGGCGACVVTVKTVDPATEKEVYRSVNSCLTPVFSCDGWEISTVEKLGNRKDCYHPIQKRLASFGGTQCGYCTPGMVMNMYSLVQSKQQLSAKEIEDHFDGNICRCTGYRPILDAFKSTAPDAHEELRRKCLDIEECNKVKCEKNISENSSLKNANRPIHLHLKSGEEWVKPNNLATAFEAVNRLKDTGSVFRFVAGNTSTGIYKEDGPYKYFIDLLGVPELKKNVIDKSGVILGGCTTLAVAIEELKNASKLEGYEYAADVSKHLQRIANSPVRNVATLAGNLMIKNTHKEFPSDVFILLGTVGASINIATAPNLQNKVSVTEFLNTDMTGKVVLSIHLPSLPASAGYYFRSFKITKRYQNAHAYVNSGFLFKIDPSTLKVLEQPTIFFGGICSTFTRASNTESYLVGKALNDQEVLQGALDSLESEIKPTNRPPDATPAYRKSLAQSLFYKAVLGVVKAKLKSSIVSGANDIEHVETFGRQVYDSDDSSFPIHQPVEKLEAAIQCSGEAEYVNDIATQPHELAGAFVLTTVANANLLSVDATDALKIPGVVQFIQAKDIPGPNNYMVFHSTPEEIFVSDKIKAAGLPVGLIIAETRETALRAAKLVKVNYQNVQKPILTIEEALAVAEKEGRMEEVLPPAIAIDVPKIATGDPKNTIKGEMKIAGQYHFTMENHVTLCIPKDGGFDVYAATQWMDHVQAAVASALKIQNNNVNVQVRRLGGGYGSKITRATPTAVACAIASHITNKPVRIALDLETNMRMVGKRLPYYAKYEVGFDDNGKIETLECKIICDAGMENNEITSSLAMICMQSGYQSSGWKISPGNVKTNTVSNTYCRSPGSTQGFAVIETIMEHIAAHLKKDPLEVRQMNFLKDGDRLLGDIAIINGDPSAEGFEELLKNPNDKFEGENLIPKMIEELKVSGQYEERKKFVADFNQGNRWKKRGLAIVPMRYPVHYFSTWFPAYVAVYHADGTVAVSHGGIEMGQGINTKIAQVVAYKLKIPLHKVKVKPSNTLVSPNAMTTGGAITSEIVSFAAMKACDLLLARMAPIKAKMKKDLSWEDLVTACYGSGIDMRAHYLPNETDRLKFYNVFGVNMIEVEVDVLTGEYKIARCDIIEDAGKSISPEIDIGQVEGAMVMGLGLWTTEKLQYDENTGQLLTANTWDYKVPFPKDIPEDFRVTLLQNTPNPVGILRSKATGEPPLCMASCVLFALRNAIDSARRDAGNTDYYPIYSPVSPEDVLKLSLSTKDKFTLN